MEGQKRDVKGQKRDVAGQKRDVGGGLKKKRSGVKKEDVGSRSWVVVSVKENVAKNIYKRRASKSVIRGIRFKQNQGHNKKLLSFFLARDLSGGVKKEM